MERIKIENGTSWPRPALESDKETGLGWKLRYAPDSLTRGDQLSLASIVDAYGFLLLQTTTKERQVIIRSIRKSLGQK